MDKFFEALEKSKGSIALDIANQVGFDETADILEKGKRASIGEIREWNGKKYQKTGNGWVPVKQGNGGKGEGQKDWTKATPADLKSLPQGTKISFYDPSEYGTIVLTKRGKEWIKKDDKTKWSYEEISDALQNAHTKDLKVEEPKGKGEELKIDESKVDKDASMELELFVTNDQSIYKNYWTPIVSMLSKKKQKVGEISKDILASSSMMESFVSNTIKEYRKEYGNISVSPDTRKYLKTKLAEQMIEEVEENEE